MKKILLHICCAPCLCYSHQALQENDLDITGFWCNPNIHPLTEYNKRLDALHAYQTITKLDIIYDKDHNINAWLTRTKKGWPLKDKKKRCLLCYKIRLEKAACMAQDKGFDLFTTTLLYSKYQFHDEIKTMCEDLSKRYRIGFLYKDFRKGWKEGIEISKKMNLYRQRYCGCIFSMR
ncbi:MAG: epoxyqueuosine reductase QueH [Spirochaetes bacterium]|nr:epoxyqueuosine reductase QueH [Spirochaetota bacterium]